MTVRTITADCQSEDGSQLIISTEYQNEAHVLSFTVNPGAEGIDSTVRVSAEDLVELLGFQNMENARYRAEYRAADEDEEVPF